MATAERRAYAAEYIVHCLKNHMYIRSEIERQRRDLCEEREDLIKDISAPSISYGEKVSTSGTSDPVYNAYERLENRRKRIDTQLISLDKDEENLNRVLLIFDRTIGFIPIHHKVVDESVFSDRKTVAHLKSDLCKGGSTITRMKENTYKVISDIANSKFDNDELSSLSSFELVNLVDGNLWSQVLKDE